MRSRKSKSRAWWSEIGLADDFVGRVVGQVSPIDNSFMIANSSKANEHPTFISERKSYAEYKIYLQMWSGITSVPKKNHAKVVVYNHDGHPSRTKENIVLNIGNQIQGAEGGIKKLIHYLDTVYEVDDMADAWSKYKTSENFSNWICHNQRFYSRIREGIQIY